MRRIPYTPIFRLFLTQLLKSREIEFCYYSRLCYYVDKDCFRREKVFMAKAEDKIRVDGTIVEALPGTQFKVELDNGHEILAYLAGKMRKYYIRVLLGDRVTIEMSPYDMTRGRIVYRHKKSTHR